MHSKTNKLQGFFITGSDTGVGKTWISCQLINQLKHTVTSLKVRKPVESGCQVLPDRQLLAADGQALYSANDNRENLQLVAPLRFKAVTSPDRAANLENQPLYLQQLVDVVKCNILPEETVLVEGAGGFYSPIAEDGLNADLAKLLDLEIIIIVEDRLGAINQGLLTIKAVESEGLVIRALILNQTHGIPDYELNNLQDLRKRTHYPVYSCSFNGLLEPVNLTKTN